MEQIGNFLGAVLLVIVTLCAWLLGRKANAGVRQFREDHHERFRGRGQR
jgi:hypothetical protein